jgi:hypothetical protein
MGYNLNTDSEIHNEIYLLKMDLEIKSDMAHL